MLHAIVELWALPLLIYTACMTLPLAATADLPPAVRARLDADGVMDFTIKRDPIPIRIDDDIFYAPAIVAPVTLRRLATLAAELQEVADPTGEKAIALTAKLFEVLMPGESGKRFSSRLLADPDDPDAPLSIDLQQQAMPALNYILERYGLRPTAPSSALPAGSTVNGTSVPSDGISSTAGASPADSEPSS